MAALDPQYIDAIKASEGYAAQPQWDYKQNSSGYGTKAMPGDENIPADQLKAVHEQRMQAAIEQAAAHVDSVNPNLPAGTRAALVSLTYNAGPGWAQSGLGDMVRSGDLEGARERFLQYNKAGGEVNQGLVARRGREAAWFGGQPQTASATPAAPAGGLLSQPTSPGPLSPQGGPPLNLAPQQAAPVFAPQPQSQQQASAPQGDIFGQMQPPPQMQPIFAPPRHAVDLSKLRAAFKAPTFLRG